jgi:hypothetical protein
MLDAWKHGKDYLKGMGAWNEGTAGELATWINDAAARTKIGSRGVRKVATAAFFSPQMIASRARLLTDATTGFGRYNSRAARYARMQTYKAVRYGAGLMFAAYLAAEMAGQDPEVEWDPRSTDFGKVRAGRTTFDPWGGFQQFVRFGAQFITGKMKKVSSGREQDISRLDTFTRFLRSKLAPVLEGSDPVGRETETAKGKARMLGEQALPLGVRDITELYEENPIHAIMFGIPVLLGASVNAGIGSREWLRGEARKDEAVVSREIRDLRLNPPRPGRRITVRGEGRTLAGDLPYKSLTRAEYEDFEKMVMPEIYDELHKYIKSNSYTKLPREQKVRALNRRIRYYNRTRSASKMLDPREIKSPVRNRWWEDW